MSSASASSSPSPNREIHVLCLHGRQQTGTLFSRRISTLMKKSSNIKYHFIDAPFIIPMKDGQTMNVREWWSAENNEKSIEQTYAMIDELWNKQQYDALLGFSQGGIIAAALCTMAPSRYRSLKCAIIVGAPDVGDWIFDPLKKFSSEASAAAGNSPLPMLVIAGHGDKIVSVESSIALAKRCQSKNPSIKFDLLEHELGHLVPSKFFNEIIDFIVRSTAVRENDEMQTQTAKEVKNGESTKKRKKKVEIDEENESTSSTQTPTKRIDVPRAASDEIANLQREEIESLEAIYGEADKPFSISSGALPGKMGDPTPTISLHLLQSSAPFSDDESDDAKSIFKRWKSSGIRLNLQLTGGYPLTESLVIEGVDSANLSNVEFPDAVRERIVSEATNIATQSIGYGCIYSVLIAIDDALHNEARSFNSSESKSIKSLDQGEIAQETSKVDQSSVDTVDEAEEERMILDATNEATKSFRIHSNEPILDGKKPGLHKIVVGLVGKPSAGKSTFFNCVTRAAMELDGRRQAQVGAYPFTTIEPNFGIGLFRPEWCETVKKHSSGGSTAEDASASIGNDHDAVGPDWDRLLPILIKDVAGLVPGAWKGLGKGNKFLNDLLDADVLVHVCDASGKSSANGVEIGDGGTTVREDAQWIRLEIHRWIAANVMSKWDSVRKWRRKSSSTNTSKQFEGERIEKRVCSLFTGYHCRSRYVQVAAEYAGLNIAAADQWSRSDIHRLVAFFISFRFPIFLALNKIDMIGETKGTLDGSGQASNAASTDILQDAIAAASENGYPAHPISGGIESFLLHASALKLVDYPIGSATFTLLGDGLSKYQSDKKFQERIDLATHVMKKYGGTGVLHAISEATKLCFPTYVFPIPPNSGSGVQTYLLTRKFLKDCFLVTPGTTVEEVYEIMHRGMSNTCSFRLDGDLVRIESKSLEEILSKQEINAPWHQISKDVVVDPSNAVLRIYTNRKVAWQQNYEISSGTTETNASAGDASIGTENQ